MIDFYIPLADWINDAFKVINQYLSPTLRSASRFIGDLIKGFEDVLLWPPAAVMIILFAVLIGWLANYRMGIFTLFGLILAYGIGIWAETMSTVALAITGTVTTLLIGIPLGILASQSTILERIIRPILDFMQTLPSFVYLIPAVMFFGMGKVAALVATMIFAMPPAVRLTILGIREVSKDIVEAAHAFGSNRWQTLRDVQLPLAMPTIMAGVNQCIMMALSMTVIASMIGAGGLGNVVLRSMQSLDIGMGTVGGLGIVILAIILDRLTENISKKMNKEKQ
jgi:glycine betaine/proline transport system permease protein